MLRKNIALIIITYNPSVDFFSNNLNLTGVKYIIVDNSETLDSCFAEKVNGFVDVDYIANQANLGIAAALNMACRHALDLGFEYVITMDQDSIISAEIINGLVDYYQSSIERDLIAVISPSHVIQTGEFANKEFIVKDQISDGIFTMSSGNLLILDKWQALNGFNEELFIDMVDMDYYARAILTGYKVRTLGYLPMPHNLGNLTTHKVLWRKLNVLHHNYIRKYYQIRNTLWFLARYQQDFPEINFFWRMMRNSVIGVILFENDKLRKLFYMTKGYWDYKHKRLGKLKEYR